MIQQENIGCIIYANVIIYFNIIDIEKLWQDSFLFSKDRICFFFPQIYSTEAEKQRF
jgi:hypothetical protein